MNTELQSKESAMKVNHLTASRRKGFLIFTYVCKDHPNQRYIKRMETKSDVFIKNNII